MVALKAQRERERSEREKRKDREREGNTIQREKENYIKTSIRISEKN